MCQVFDKFSINYENWLIEWFCKLNNNIPIIGSESHALDRSTNAFNTSQPIKQFRNSAAQDIPLHFFSHCCAPNTCYVFNGRELQLRAIKSIDFNQEITLSYIRLDKLKAERQEELMNCSIDCKCIRCETSINAFSPQLMS